MSVSYWDQNPNPNSIDKFDLIDHGPCSNKLPGLETVTALSSIVRVQRMMPLKQQKGSKRILSDSCHLHTRPIYLVQHRRITGLDWALFKHFLYNNPLPCIKRLYLINLITQIPSPNSISHPCIKDSEFRVLLDIGRRRQNTKQGPWRALK